MSKFDLPFDIHMEISYTKAHLRSAIYECGEVATSPTVRAHLESFLEKLSEYDFYTPPEREEKSADLFS